MKPFILSLLLLVSVQAQATVINFSGTTTNTNIPANYASNVSADGTAWSVSNGATPNIALSWSYETGTAQQRWEFYNDAEWSGVAQMNDTLEGTKYWISFTPDSGYGVILDSFVFDDYAGEEGGSDFSWNLYQDSTNGTVISSGNIITTDGQNLTVNTGMNLAYEGTIVLELFNNETNEQYGYSEALDDIAFRQIAINTNEHPASSTNTLFNGELKVFTLNVWHDGEQVADGVDKVADLVIASDADVVAFIEARSTFLSNLLPALASKGETNYFSGNVGDRSIISRYPLVATNELHGAITAFKIFLKPNLPLTLCVAHLDYTHYAVYLPRGYNGGSAPYGGWGMIDANSDGIPDYVTNVTDILNYDLQSLRDEALDAFISYAATRTAAGEDLILFGDFNDCSHLDWTDSTRDLFGHQGLVIPWNGSVHLATNGWIDTYRECYPDPVTHPGLTWPSEAFGKGSTGWAHKSDERDRIDYIYYNKQKLNTRNSYVAGSPVYYKADQKETIQSEDLFLFSQMPWPSDHKGVITTFYLDSDGDGMPDSWETSYGLNPTNSADATQDLDSDLENNREEYFAGSDPTNGNSYFKGAGSVDIENDQILLEWQSSSNRLYSIYRSTNMLNGFQSLETNLEYPQNSYTDATHNLSQGFYKIRVRLK